MSRLAGIGRISPAMCVVVKKRRTSSLRCRGDAEWSAARQQLTDRDFQGDRKSVRNASLVNVEFERRITKAVRFPDIPKQVVHLPWKARNTLPIASR